MGPTFVGGSRDGTEVAEDLADAFVKAGDGALIKMESGKARELYVREDDGQLHYVKTVPPKKWRQSGDPCPACESRKTTFLRMAAQPDDIFCSIGGTTYTLNGKRLAMVGCEQCKGVITVDLDER